MRWSSLGTLTFLLGVVAWCQSIETPDHAPSSDKTYHFPSASLTIAGDLKDVKLKGTIAQLVRALQQPTSSVPTEPVKAKENPEPKPKTTHQHSSGTKKIIHPSQLITKFNIHKNGKKLYYGDPIPETITVSSQSVKVTQSNTTGDKRARHLQAFIGNSPSPVKTITGTRVPDNEEDKHYTWRQARVIKNFLVPNGRPANPHKKRQVIITDPQQYLAAAAAAQAQGATTIIDATLGNNGQPRTSVFYAQEGSATNNNNAALFAAANDPSQQRSHPHVVYQNQQQVSSSAQQHHSHNQHHQTAATNGQTSAFSYNPQHQQNAHMYVVQDGNAFNVQQYQANQAAPSSSSHQHQAQLVHQQSQSQFFSRSGEVSTAASQSSQQQQQGSASGTTGGSAALRAPQTQQTLSAQIKEQQQYQSGLDTQAIQAAVEAVQQLEAQQQAAAAGAGTGQQQAVQQQQQSQLAGQIQQAQQVGIPGLLQAQQIQLAAQGSSPQQTVVIPQTAGGATAQEILAAAAAANGQLTAQYIQIQPSQEQQLQLQLQQQQQQAGQQQPQQHQYPASNQFAERQTFPGSGGGAVTGTFAGTTTQYVIQPQTYVQGQGGPTFTVPIPVPVEQAAQVLTQQQSHQQNHHQQQQQQQSRNNHGHNNHHNQYQQQHYQGGNNNGNNRHLHQQHQGQNSNQQQSSIGDRMKQVSNQIFTRKMLERVETNAVVPALASTGLFLGLSALAAGWYLSKNNREVGIVRRTGKFSKKSGAPNSSGNGGGGIVLPAPEEKEKENTANTRTRRDLASMVTPQQYSPSGAPEVDQATFFQSIIQQSLEKTQTEYDTPAEQPVYSHSQQDNYGSHDNSGPVGYHRGEPEPERQGPPPPGPAPSSRYRSKYSRYNDRPSKYSSRDDDYYEPPASSRISKSQQLKEKSDGWSVHSAKNFARVAIPAIVLTGAAIGIIAVIFGWYISGDNREIAFLESPTTNSIGQGGWSRRKRSLFGSSNAPASAAWSDGWLIRTLKAIHGNPYDNMPAPTAKSFVPYPYFLDKDSSKTSTLEFKVSNNGLAGVLAGGAVLAVVALGLINSFSESSGRNLKTARYNHLLTHSASSAATNANSKSSTNPLTHLRAPRTMAAHFDNNLEFQHAAGSPSFFESIISSLEASGDTVMNKLSQLSQSNWQQSNCTKRIVCQVITSQGDDTVRIMEKKMASVMKM